MFDLSKLKEESGPQNRYERRLQKLQGAGQDIDRIKSVIESAINNIRENRRSFVIYGEPQSGKTEMMIALTAKLVDEGFQIVVVLLNDSVQLLNQNLERFQHSGLSPAPKKIGEILSPDVTIGAQQWVIFCKKNSKDLKKLSDKIGPQGKRVIIDDEADYATPNSRINQSEKSRINEITEKLIGEERIYIGVTATPARLDLNRTHGNQNEDWIDFPVHSNYTGQDHFFPFSSTDLPYRLTPLATSGNDPDNLRDAIFSFLVNSAFLNISRAESNYSILIHTSSKKTDHTASLRQVLKIFEAMRNNEDPDHEQFLEKVWNIAKDRFPGSEDGVTGYVISNIDRSNVVVMNSDKDVNAADNRTATDPTTPFTVVIGGNIVSRGVTFNNLLGMFFTRNVRGNLQQDTYIQRARMFGARGNYLKYFELTIPENLYSDWQRCFVFHRLSLQSRMQDRKSPV